MTWGVNGGVTTHVVKEGEVLCSAAAGRFTDLLKMELCPYIPTNRRQLRKVNPSGMHQTIFAMNIV